MVKSIKSKSQEWARMNKSRLNGSFSIKVARSKAGQKQIYRIPSGVYYWRK